MTRDILYPKYYARDIMPGCVARRCMRAHAPDSRIGSLVKHNLASHARPAEGAEGRVSSLHARARRGERGSRRTRVGRTRGIREPAAPAASSGRETIFTYKSRCAGIPALMGITRWRFTWLNMHMLLSYYGIIRVSGFRRMRRITPRI
jgi:hypothetical protein